MFKPENPLEEALIAADEDPARIGDVYRRLLDAVLYVLKADPPPDGYEPGKAQAGPVDLVVSWFGGIPHLHAFSSLDRLRDALVPGTERVYLEIPGEELLRMLNGSGLLLNPGSEHGGLFDPNGLAYLVENGSSIFDRATEHVQNM